jgi:hemoglobin
MASLYERLGGLEAITSVVDSFVARCAGDDRINRKFDRSDVTRLKKMLVDQVCARRQVDPAPTPVVTCG